MSFDWNINVTFNYGAYFSSNINLSHLLIGVSRPITVYGTHFHRHFVILLLRGPSVHGRIDRRSRPATTCWCVVPASITHSVFRYFIYQIRSLLFGFIRLPGRTLLGHQHTTAPPHRNDAPHLGATMKKGFLFGVVRSSDFFGGCDISIKLWRPPRSF